MFYLDSSLPDDAVRTADQDGGITNMALSLREIKPKTARTKRIVESKAPQHVENPRTTLYLRYTSSSEVLNLVMADLHALQRPRARKFNKKNPIHPFEDASSLEFFSQKNDASLMVFASHAKKRPHCLTLARFFDARVLDMLELLVDPDSLRTLRQFPTAKPPVGAKPLLAFSGAPFDSPVAGPHTLARSLLTDLFRGPDAAAVDVEGLRHLIHFTADEEADGRPPAVHMRCYLLRTASVAGTTLPRVEVEEMGPRIDFRLGRRRDADPDMWKESLKRPANSEVRFIPPIPPLFFPVHYPPHATDRLYTGQDEEERHHRRHRRQAGSYPRREARPRPAADTQDERIEARARGR